MYFIENIYFATMACEYFSPFHHAEIHENLLNIIYLQDSKGNMVYQKMPEIRNLRQICSQIVPNL